MLSTYHIPTTKIRAKQKSTLFNPLNPQKRFSGKFLGIDYAMLPNCEWNQKYKKQPWSNVECFAFGPKDKNQSPFHGEKTQMTKWFFGRRLYQHSKTIFNGRDAILRVRSKWLIINVVSLLWADVKYHVPTGFGFSPKASGFYPFGDATDLAGEGGVGDVVWMIQASAWNQTCHSTNDRCEALASLKGCFLCFLFQSHHSFYHWSQKKSVIIG